MSVHAVAELARLPQADLQNVDPAVLIVLGIVGLGFLGWLFGGSSTQPQETQAQTPEAPPVPTDRQKVESFVRLLQDIEGQDRVNHLRGFYRELPDPLPEDLIPQLLRGTRGNTRLEAIRLLGPKLPHPLSPAIGEQIADPTLMNAYERNQALPIFYPH